MSTFSEKPTKKETKNLWYKNYIVLIFVIGLPVFVVIVCIYFIIFSIKIQDATVRDDWYMDGKTLYQDASRDQLSYDLGISGILRFDNNNIQFLLNYPKDSLQSGQLRNQTPLYYPKTLQLNISHATDEQQDQDVILTHQNNNIYHGQITKPLIPARYYLQISTHEHLNWRLTKRERLPIGNVIFQPLDAFESSSGALPDQRNKRGQPSPKLEQIND